MEGSGECPCLISVVSHKQGLSTGSAASSRHIFALAGQVVSLSDTKRLVLLDALYKFDAYSSLEQNTYAAYVKHFL